MNMPSDAKKNIVKFYLNKPLTEKKGFFPQRREFKWVKINKEKALNDEGNLTEYGKEKLLGQNVKAECAYNGYDGHSAPSNDDVKEMVKTIKEDMIAKGAW